MMTRLASLPAFLLATPALAHPGHATGGLAREFLHWFTEADHLAIMALTALGIAFLASPSLRLRARGAFSRLTRR
jgi:hydrogenase/urease accessory protein HupE